MSKQQFSDVVVETMLGQNLLPESNIIKLTYQRLYGEPDRQLLTILGSNWRFAARAPYPRLRGANNLVVPNNKFTKEAERARKNVNESEDNNSSDTSIPDNQNILGAGTITGTTPLRQ